MSMTEYTMHVYIEDTYVYMCLIYITDIQSDSSLVRTCVPQDTPHAIAYVVGTSTSLAELMQGSQLCKCQKL